MESSREAPSLSEVVETSLCRYTATVCVPELCVRVPPPPSPPPPPPGGAAGPPPLFVALIDRILGDGTSLVLELEGRGGEARVPAGATLPESAGVPKGWAAGINAVRFG